MQDSNIASAPDQIEGNPMALKRNPVEVSLDGVHGTGNDLLSHNL